MSRGNLVYFASKISNVRILFFIIGLTFISNASAQSWDVIRMAPMPMRVANNAVCEGEVNGVKHMYSFGGIDTTKHYSGITKRSFRYNMTSDTWDTIAPLPDTLGKIASAASNVKGTIYIVGGYHVLQGGGEVSSDRVHRYDPQNNVYLSDGAKVPVPIDDQVQGVWRDSLIYVITGWSNSTNVPNVQVYNPALDAWSVGTSLPNNNFYKSFGASGTIVGDTIYYFGGASVGGFNFPGQSYYRKGAIDPANPLSITWSYQDFPGEKAYRSAVIVSNALNPYWIGGSEVTYNYNGIAYNGSGGVTPADTMRLINRFGMTKYVPQNNDSIPMDLRGAARKDDNHWFICGGMEGKQRVTDATIQLVYHNIGLGTPVPKEREFTVYPNPVSGKFRCSGGLMTSVVLRDATGRIVQKAENIEAFDLSALPNGIYHATIYSMGRIAVRKLYVYH